MTKEAIEAAARAIMIARSGQCLVTDWREADRNPAVAEVLQAARAAAPALMEEGARLALEAAAYIASKEAQGWLKIGTSTGASNMTAAKYKARHQAGGEIVAKIRALDPAAIVKGAGHE